MTTEDMESVIQALQIYKQDVGENIQVMNNAATDCIDNMGSDVFSEQAASRLQECVAKLSGTLEQADDLIREVQKALSEVTEAENILRG